MSREQLASAREALIAQLIGELDALTRRVETLGPALAQATTTLAAGTAALTDAQTRLLAAAGALGGSARAELAKISATRVAELTRPTLEAHEQALRDAATLALRDAVDRLAAPAMRELAAARAAGAPGTTRRLRVTDLLLALLAGVAGGLVAGALLIRLGA